MNKKLIKRLVAVIILAGIGYGTWFVWPRLPIITAFAAKGMCSSVFSAEKQPERVKAEDLSFFPISLAKTTVDYNEKSATSTVFGLAKRKAVFREGFGSVIVLKTPAGQLQEQKLKIPVPEFSPDTVAWPKGNIIEDTVPAGVNTAQLNRILEECFDKPGEEPFKKTLGVVVVYENQIIGEKYLDGYNSNSMFHGWSMTKSITGAWAGILADRGLLTLDEPAGIEVWQNDERSNITVKDVLQMSTGLDWFENYFTISDATVMLMQSEDMLASISKCKSAHNPGAFWNYSSGDANLLSGIIRKKAGSDNEYHTGIYKDLLHRAGMLGTIVETDANGLFVASSYSYCTARDWARFGLLFLNNGVFAGDTILSAGWVDFMKTAAPASDGKYAGTFWLKEPEEENALTDVPGDIFFADGFLGQRIYIVPSKNLIAVRLGFGMGNFSMNDFLKEVIETLPL